MNELFTTFNAFISDINDLYSSFLTHCQFTNDLLCDGLLSDYFHCIYSTSILFSDLKMVGFDDIYLKHSAKPSFANRVDYFKIFDGNRAIMMCQFYRNVFIDSTVCLLTTLLTTQNECVRNFPSIQIKNTLC